MKLFTTSKIKALDAYTIEHEPISSVDLMERAANRIADWLLRFFDGHVSLKVFAGAGNNGGDALAVARILAVCGFEPEVYLLNSVGKLSPDCAENKARLEKQGKVKFVELKSEADFPFIDSDDWMLDGLFGSGLNRSLDGIYAALVKHINEARAKVISIDIPSGLFGEDNSQNDLNAIVQADYTLSLQFPKMAFLMPENEQFVGQWEVLDIGLHPEALRNTATEYSFLEEDEALSFVKPRGRFSHKGTYGHALFIGGSYGKMGAAVLASKACLRSGVGLLSVHCPECGVAILQTAVPEAMCLPDKDFAHVSLLTDDLSKYSAVGIGCGLSTEPDCVKVLEHLLQDATQPLVIDADALNLLSENKELLSLIPTYSILTPHPKEFERLAGAYSSRWEQIQMARKLASEYKVFIVLKGAYTAIISPEGAVRFNSTGNSGMATGGSGDVLCGMILALLAQGYSADEAALLGVFLHGRAGDIAAEKHGKEGLIASDIISEIRFL